MPVIFYVDGEHDACYVVFRVDGGRAEVALYLCHVSPGSEQLDNSIICPTCGGDSLWAVADDENEDNEFIVCKECESVFQA